MTRDITASLGYLARLGLEDCRQLRVLLMMPEKIRIACGAVNLPIHSLRFVSPADAASQLDLPYAPENADTYGDALFAAWLVTRKGTRMPLTSPQLSEAKRTNAIHFVGARVALAAFALSIGVTGLQASDLDHCRFTTAMRRPIS